MDDEDRDKYIQLIKEEQRNRLIKRIMFFLLFSSLGVAIYYGSKYATNMTHLTCNFTQ